MYEAVKHDIEMTLEILKPSVAICGHDFADRPLRIRGVKKAVLEKIGQPDKTYVDTSWIKFSSRD